MTSSVSFDEAVARMECAESGLKALQGLVLAYKEYMDIYCVDRALSKELMFSDLKNLFERVAETIPTKQGD